MKTYLIFLLFLAAPVLVRVVSSDNAANAETSNKAAPPPTEVRSAVEPAAPVIIVPAETQAPTPNQSKAVRKVPATHAFNLM